MELTFVDFIYIIGTCLEGFFFGTISVSCAQVTLAKTVQHFPIPGLYSGIFALYLQHHGSQQSAGRAKNIVFYALWVLYALSAATIIVEILNFDLYLVSMNDPWLFTFISITCNTEYRSGPPCPWNHRNRSICLLRLHRPIYSSTYNWQCPSFTLFF